MSHVRLFVCSLCTAVVLAVAASAQIGPAPGELWLYSPAFQGADSASGALVRYDPGTATGTMAVDTFITPQRRGSVAWDPVRNGVVFVGSLNTTDPQSMWLLDAQGALHDLGHAGQVLWCLAPAPNGKIYVRWGDFNAGRVWYHDTDGVLRTLLDEDGIGPFQFGEGALNPYQFLIYHAPTHSLICAGAFGAADCSGGTSTDVLLRRVALSADGTRAVGPETCGGFDVSTSTEQITGLSRLPDGDLLLVVDTNSNGAEPRMLRVDPVTLAITPFAWSGSFLGAAAVSGGTWSSALGRAVMLDSFQDDLRIFSEGESGEGVLLGVSPKTSASTGSGEVATLIEIDSVPCAGGWTGVGAGLAGLGGYEPTLSGSGCPLPGTTVTLHVGSARGGAQGALFVGLSQASLPFKGGTLHVAPILLTVPFAVGGVVDAAGGGAVSFPAAIPPIPGLAGVDVLMQAGFADSAAPVGVSLTGALVMEIG